MQGRDEIDSSQAKAFAWRFVVPGGVVPPEWAEIDAQSSAPVLPSPFVRARAAEPAAIDSTQAPDVALTPEHMPPRDPPDAEDRTRAKTQAACLALAAAVADAWAEAGGDGQDEQGYRVVKRLLARADR